MSDLASEVGKDYDALRRSVNILITAIEADAIVQMAVHRRMFPKELQYSGDWRRFIPNGIAAAIELCRE